MPPETVAELDALDLRLAQHPSERWHAFYQDRAKPCPFFGTQPDESLAGWVADGSIRPGRALDLGCGNGRNAVFLARSGFRVEAVDFAASAIAWARERAAQAGVEVAFRQQSVFELGLEPGAYDLVYDSGCFHHQAPHRRTAYVRLVATALRPGGVFGLTCFRPEGGSGLSDPEVYERGTLGGGLGYTEERLRDIWSAGLSVQELRPMQACPPDSGRFGEPFLWVMRAQRPVTRSDEDPR